jgi:hypothetical protein
VRASGERLVYDITVDGPPEFFAGGLLVHNCTFTGAAGERSPDRLDSLVWAASPFLNVSLEPPKPAGVVPWAAGQDLARAGMGPEQAMHQRRLARVHGGAGSKGPDTWDLDTFAPEYDKVPGGEDGAEGDRPRKSNVVPWR